MDYAIAKQSTDLFNYFNEERPAPPQEIRGAEEVRAAFSMPGLPDTGRFHLKTESYLLKLAYANNKILSLSNSRTRILAHQVESTHQIVSALNHRFLLADEVGLGKTIEAGLVIKEFIYRYNYRRVLIICPASLQNQWQSEMSGKFNEQFTIVDRRSLLKARRSNGGNGWAAYDKAICSIDFIKSKSLADELSRTEWDAVIIDEAHRLRKDAVHSTQAYVTAEMISERTKAMLLLSATPFRGKLEELYFLLKLLDPNLLGPFTSFQNEFCMEGADLSPLKNRISRVVIRRTKRDVGGFTTRHARTVRFDLYPDERLLYDETTRYVAEEFNRAMHTENRAVGFVMTVFQKLLDSSSYALKRALYKRKARLEGALEKAHLIVKELPGGEFEDIDDIEDVDAALDRYSAEKTAVELREEIKTLSRLITLAEAVKEDKKGERLVRLLRELRRNGTKKFLIFTQFRTTQDYLAGELKGFDVQLFHGSLNRDEKEDAIIRFKNEAEVLIATEAGGEGRNMQFCNVIINYDLPWSPLKIEQRIGRLHRFGQTEDVFIYNFSTRDTVAERVLEVLTRKLKLFEESLGSPDVLLGQLEDELNLNTLFMEVASGRKKKREADHIVEERIKNARLCYEKLSELTVTGRMDFNYDEYYRITLKERQFSNRRIEQFAVSASCHDSQCGLIIGTPDKKKGIYPVRNSVDTIAVEKQGTFDSQIALENESLEFLAFGHPAVERLIARCQSDEFGGLAGVKFLKGLDRFTGMVFNFVVTFRAAAVTQELIPVAVDACGTVERSALAEIESECGEQDLAADPEKINEYRMLIDRIRNGYEICFESARERLKEKISRRVSDISDTLDLEIDPELDRIKESYDKRIKELDEKLQIQEAKMKWEGRDMRGAITRTVNALRKAELDRERLLEKYRGYMGVTHEVFLLNAAVLIGRG
jgi:SNF2 family DNA or RNA helicase